MSASPDPDLSDFEESPPRTLLYVQIETLFLNVDSLGGELLNVYALLSARVNVLLWICASRRGI